MTTTDSLKDFYNPALGVPWVNNSKMTTAQHLERVKTKCEYEIKITEATSAFSRGDGLAALAIAGWRATIAAIEALEKVDYEFGPPDAVARVLCNAILAAWPEEVL